ncbi:5-dehydro-4-deoxyglucarate dehydratase [Glycomyces buryatensis]|uniref:Probable 5-dehydro-4-deoxyglucarate dehydratase n=1 Tax=Glycomyces buryatensis TaxID=2570927 RepID=A0A4V4HSQ1_9ACTN|nr:5-dehydro-4-deoxyglucarate dehydratase [Glycomyces buryatensis]THV42546.1 5-dehydro-4-deoxyglucarate dehydratase [Glycomyces buryatensis]
MTRYAPAEIQRVLGSGLLSFPVTHFRDDLSFDEAAYRENLGHLATYPASGLFAAGGTGEFFSLTPAEVATVLRAAVEQAAGAVPIVAPAGYGTAQAIAFAKDAEQAGADAVLLFPPYLTEASQAGLFAHAKAVCDATSLGVILYHRANAAFDVDTVALLADACPNFIGFKDGIGDIEFMTRLYTTLGERLLYIGGLPTAETFALPYLQLGVTTYSSAIFNFVPEFALAFYDDVRAGDSAAVYRRLAAFVLPYLEIRNGGKGYAVSIVKAGMRAAGRPAGPVRPPLTELSEDEFAALSALVEQVKA